MVAAPLSAPPARPPIAAAPRCPAVRSAASLAAAYDSAAAACWRGEGEGDRFFAWLSAYRVDGTEVPTGLPAAVSVHGAGGRGIAWYAAAEAILGRIPGAAWGYEVPRGVPLPAPRADPDRRLAVIGSLHPDEVEAVLHHQHVGRLACLADGRPYVVPVTYAYAGGDVYGHTFAGRKLAALRADPRVCFEVDAREDPDHWCSVVAEGRFEELTDPAERQTALGLLASAEADVPSAAAGSGGTVFRLRLTTKSGRFVARLARD